MPIRPLPTLLGLAATVILAALATLRTPFVPSFPRVVAFCVCGAAGLLFLWRGRRCSVYGTAAAVAILMALHSAGRWQSQLLPEACERQEIQFRGEVRGLPVSQESFGEAAYGFVLDVHSITPPDCASPRRLRLFMPRRWVHDLSGPETELRPGDFLGGSARLKRPWGFVNPDAERG
ncbi:MAG: DUF4131 domain-containing protein, partial [Pseudomonadota bacterium]